MRDRQRIENEVAEIFSHKLHVDVPSHDCDLFQTGILDSLQLVELLFELEQQFGVRMSIEETDFEHFRSIERIGVMLACRDGNEAHGLNPRALNLPLVAEIGKQESME